MDLSFFNRPILNSPYAYPTRHWELDSTGQPTHRILERRRSAEFITPIPKPQKHTAAQAQIPLVMDEGLGLSTEQQQYDLTGNINLVRGYVDRWRMNRPLAFSTGGITRLPVCTRFFARWKRWKP